MKSTKCWFAYASLFEIIIITLIANSWPKKTCYWIEIDSRLLYGRAHAVPSSQLGGLFAFICEKEVAQGFAIYRAAKTKLIVDIISVSTGVAVSWRSGGHRIGAGAQSFAWYSHSVFANHFSHSFPRRRVVRHYVSDTATNEILDGLYHLITVRKCSRNYIYA